MGFFDEATYKSRFLKYLELTSAKHLFHSEKKISFCKKIIESDSSNAGKDHEHVYAACIHPNTKTIVPVYGRMAFFVPVNIPICTGMLLTRPTFQNLVLWQWFNQTYNALFNYNNSPNTKSSSTGLDETSIRILKGYMASVAVSVGLAVGLTQWVKNGRISLKFRTTLQKFVPYVSSASAGMANVGLMRSSELSSGIPVYSTDDTYLGHSKIAAKRALVETALSRAVLPFPMLALPPPVIALASKMTVFKSSALRMKLMELSIVILTIAIGFPAALALYPQYTIVDVSSLEDSIRNVVRSKQTPFLVKFNKGV